ncbi:MAG: chemotaxis response regulator protein-glutamate methylesterase [Verrucomicrobia bacterium]|nr:chemotaxis response regulator protein-glutamate methylesterase [Verrucomicrobiota bacterium]
MTDQKRIRVLVVDDSPLVRRVLTDSLNHDPQIEVVGTAANPYVARDQILALEPDVMTLDIEMPRMDGLTFLKILMQHHPLPIIVVSTATQSGSAKALEALHLGAVDVIGKPGNSHSVGETAELLAEKVKAAATVNVRKRVPLASDSVAPSRLTSAPGYHPRQIILIGASTGGTEAIKNVLTKLPQRLPGICIVQHIPAYFSKAFAERLNALCAMEVREATDGDRVKSGLALIAPGNYHMLLQWHTDHYRVHLKQGPHVWHQRPAVDVLFASAANCASEFAVAALLTGMGVDGADGMQKLKENGARTIAQDEESCVVFGMPRAAIHLGVVDHVVPLQQISETLVKLAATPHSKHA